MSGRTTSTRKVRYAVVGLGHIAQVAVLPAFKTANNSELATIVSGEPEKREKLSKQYLLEHVYSYNDYERALAEVDAVYWLCQTICIVSMPFALRRRVCTFFVKSPWR